MTIHVKQSLANIKLIQYLSVMILITSLRFSNIRIFQFNTNKQQRSFG